jgi:hypothetical protein
MTPAVDGGVAATAADGGVAAMAATTRLRAAVAERSMALAGFGGVAATAADGGVAATAAGNSCRRAAAAERVAGVVRTPNRDATDSTRRRGLRHRRSVASQLELSSDDGGVAERRRRTGAIGDGGRSRRDKLRGGRGKCDADSPAVTVYIAGR